MSSTAPLRLRISLVGTAENRAYVRDAIANSGTPLEVMSETKDETVLAFPSNIFSVSVLINVVETKLEQLKGDVTMPDGRVYHVDKEGLEGLRGSLLEALRQPQQTAPPNLWWVYFLPEIKGLITEFTKLLRWYPRAISEGEHQVTRNFTILIGSILLGVGFLTYVGRISGDAFVFVVGIILGYVFSFLHKFLGLSTTAE